MYSSVSGPGTVSNGSGSQEKSTAHAVAVLHAGAVLM